MGVGVGRPEGPAGGGLGGRPGEPVDGLVAERVAAGDVEDLVAPTGPVEVAGEADRPLGRVGLEGPAPDGEDHLDDRVERTVGQDLQGGVGRRRPRRAGAGALRGRHDAHTL